MSEVSSKTICVCDHGLFLPLALKLAESFKRVLYWTPTAKGFPLLNDHIIGDGYDNLERIEDFWPIKKQIDLFVFPDIQHSGLQLELESQGFPVWGSRAADSIELSRQKFLKVLKEVGLPVPGYKVVEGLWELRDYCSRHNDKFVKISKYRGTMETWHHTTYDESEPLLDALAVKFGAAKELIPFIVFDPIETDIEVGFDGYCIDGKFPSLAIGAGIEIKDKAYICSIQKTEDMPEQVQEVNKKFGPALAKYRFRNFFSSEIRVKDEKPYFIDPCVRCPSPATEAQIELYGNLAEIIWHGAHGELINPEPTAQFAVECVLTMKGDKQNWGVLDIPAKVRQWIKCGQSCQINGRTCFPPDGSHGDEAGWLVAIGNSIEQAVSNLRSHIEALEGCPVTPHPEALYDAIKQVHQAEEEGVPFTDKEIPEPETVLQ